ncbi:MAG: hypothetical protein HZB55_17155 [Deltaproteobacteria bacterium]|nr:hypothetical protein [Deltaproteobacteria bacterium]
MSGRYSIRLLVMLATALLAMAGLAAPNGAHARTEGFESGNLLGMAWETSGDVGWRSIAGGSAHTVAVKADGSLWAWGHNGSGRLGDGTTEDRSTPTRIGTETDWASAAAGLYHTVAVKTDGSLWAWGYNDVGQLGDGTTENRSTPTRIGSDTNWARVAAGWGHTVAIKTDGTLWAWGYNYDGLGDGTVGKLTPTRIGSGTDWAHVAAGWGHTVAVKTDGSLWAWGDNGAGQLGVGGSADMPTPTRIGSDTNWGSVAAEYTHTVAVKTDGTLWAWGGNQWGQLGDGTTEGKLTPTRIGSDTNWARVAGGYANTVAVKTDGTLWAWGGNQWGQLGDGTTESKLTPTWIGSDANWVAVEMGWEHTLAVKADGSLWAWGGDGAGELGDGGGNKSTPTRIGTASNWASAAAGFAHTVVVRTDGSLWAWGANDNGQLGDGATAYQSAPTRIGSETDWARVAAGGFNTVAVKADGSLWAWGNNYSGQLGDGTTEAKFTPTRIGSDTDWTRVAVAAGWTVAVKTDGSLWAWGENYFGQLGDGTTENKLTPTRIGTDTDWASVAIGTGCTVGLKTDGSLWAWGANSSGQLGDGTRVNKLMPTRIGTDTDWASVAVGDYTLAVKADASLWAWGANESGQFGDGTWEDKLTPTRIGNDANWASAVMGSGYTVALKADGSLCAWGSNWRGQLGDGTMQDRATPTRIGSDTNWESVATGDYHTLAVKADGSLWAWGDNAEGQLGDGSAWRETPTLIVGASVTGSVSGVVRTDDTGAALAGILVCADGPTGKCVPSGADGAYVLTELAPGEYRVAALGDATHAGEYWKDTTAYCGATPLTVAAGQVVRGIDFGLAGAGSISGTVVAEGNGLPLSDIWVCTSGCQIFYGCSLTDASGHYHLTALAAGTYQVDARPGPPYVGKSAYPVAVIVGIDTSGVNFSLALMDSDGDGVPDPTDAFPNDPAASLDTDGDGHPDAWNAGATPEQIAASHLTLDLYPNDPARWANHFGEPVATALWADFHGALTIEGVPAVVGDEVTVHDPQGVLCGHFVVGAPGSYGVLRVYGDDPATPGDEGAVPGDVLTFKVWDSVSRRERATVLQVIVGSDPPEWQPGGSSQVNVDGQTPLSLSVTLSLRQGWNLISFPLAVAWHVGDPPTAAVPTGTVYQPVAAIGDVFAGIAGKYSVVRSFDADGAHSFDPTLPKYLSDLTYVAGGYGYWIKMKEAADLVLEGLPLDPAATRPLTANWNLVGYWGGDCRHVGDPPTDRFGPGTVFTPVARISDILQSVVDKLIVVRSFDAGGAHSYNPTLPDYLSDLTYMGPGYGYWVKMNGTGELRY